MSKKEFNKYTLTELRTEAADIKFGWINIIFDFLGAPNSPMPGSLNTFLQTMFGQYAINRDYLGAIVGDKVSSKLGGVIAVDNFVSSDKVEKLLAAQAIMISPDLMLVDPALGFDEIRHNYQWAGTLIEVQENFGKSVDNRPTYCVLHPDDSFEPVALVSGLTIRASCTQANPNYSNEIRKNISHEERMKIIKAREMLLSGRVKM